MSTVVITGTQWGDEGKGKIVDYLAQQAETVVRYQGGSNAGHTVAVKGEEYKLRLLPSGILYKGTHNVIANGVAVDPEVMLQEMDAMEKRGIDVSGIRLSDRAHVVMPYHRVMDGIGDEARGNRSHQSFILNGRLIKSNLLTGALEEACKQRVMIGKYPMCVLHLTMPFEAADVNVHPNKLEVRFKDEALMRQVAEHLLATAFEGERVLQLDEERLAKPAVARAVEVRPVRPPEAPGVSQSEYAAAVDRELEKLKGVGGGALRENPAWSPVTASPRTVVPPRPVPPIAPVARPVAAPVEPVARPAVPPQPVPVPTFARPVRPEASQVTLGETLPEANAAKYRVIIARSY